MDVFAKLEAAQLTFEDDKTARIEGSDTDITFDADDVKSEFSPSRSDASCSPPAALSNKSEYICQACQTVILDSYLLKVNELPWHETCLKCCMCGVRLGGEESCYIRDCKVYCYEDYLERFASKCAKCNREIEPSDWIRKARGYLYHLDCFNCHVCGKQMNTGDVFGLEGTVIYCEEHCSKPKPPSPVKRPKVSPTDVDMPMDLKKSVTLNLPHHDVMPDSPVPSSVKENQQKGIKRRRSTVNEDGSKRRRTAFNEEQLLVLQDAFNVNQMPGTEEQERLSHVTGLEKRVVQVWFQNARANRKRGKKF